MSGGVKPWPPAPRPKRRLRVDAERGADGRYRAPAASEPGGARGRIGRLLVERGVEGRVGAFDERDEHGDLEIGANEAAPATLLDDRARHRGEALERKAQRRRGLPAHRLRVADQAQRERLLRDRLDPSEQVLRDGGPEVLGAPHVEIEGRDLRGDRPIDLVEHGGEEILFVGEIVVVRALPEAGCREDLVERGVGEAAIRELGRRRLEEASAPFRLEAGVAGKGHESSVVETVYWQCGLLVHIAQHILRTTGCERRRAHLGRSEMATVSAAAAPRSGRRDRRGREPEPISQHESAPPLRSAHVVVVPALIATASPTPTATGSLWISNGPGFPEPTSPRLSSPAQATSPEVRATHP